jgi:hypothetical protein
MKTVAVLAKELNVSVQTIYRALNAVKHNETEHLIEKFKGVSYFTTFGEKLIRERLTVLNSVKDDNDGHLTAFNSEKQDECLTVLNSVKQDERLSVLNSEKQDERLSVLNSVKHDNDRRLTALNSEKQDECLTVLNTVKHDERLSVLNSEKHDDDERLTVLNTVKHGENEEILFLREQNKALLTELEREREYNRKALEQEREHSRTQADKLANLAEQLAELSRNNQILLGAEQSRTNPALLMGDGETEAKEEQPVKKKSFWNLFKNQKE